MCSVGFFARKEEYVGSDGYQRQNSLKQQYQRENDMNKRKIIRKKDNIEEFKGGKE